MNYTSCSLVLLFRHKIQFHRDILNMHYFMQPDASMKDFLYYYIPFYEYTLQFI